MRMWNKAPRGNLLTQSTFYLGMFIFRWLINHSRPLQRIRCTHYLSAMLRGALLVVCTLLSTCTMAQYTTTPLNPVHGPLLQHHLRAQKEIKPMGFAPYLMPIEQLDSIYDADSKHWQRKDHQHWILRKMRNEHLIEVHTENFILHGDAGFNLEAGRDEFETPQRTLYTNTRGYTFNGTIGEHFFFNTSFYETQSVFPDYLDSLVLNRGDFNDPADPERGSIPGYGRWKPFNTGSASYDYDYTLATGAIGYAFSEHSFVQFGHEKQFVGYGYRSLLLSDASAPYPFLRAQVSFWKNRITYTTTWAVLQSLDRVSDKNYANKEALFRRLGGKFNYLHFQPLHWLGIGLFDGTTWTWRRNSNPNLEYYMPYGWLYTGTGVRNHLIGLNYFVSPLSFLTLYGQQAWNTVGGGYASQFGAKVNIGTNLQFLVEWNNVTSGLYFTNRDTADNYVQINELFQPGTAVLDYYQHNDQMLGHPMGVPLDEFLFRVNYRIRDFVVSAALHSTEQQLDKKKVNIRFFQMEGGYIINPRSNAQLMVGMIRRTEETNPTLRPPLQTNYTYIAFRTNLFNRYLDF